MLNSIKESGEPINLIGDGRCDSPGYKAKFATYTLMNDKNVHVGNTKNSQNMEKFWLEYLLQ